MNVNGLTFVITGAASGLGAGVARTVVAAGANVMLIDMNEAAVSAVSNEIGAQADFRVADVADEGAVAEAIRATVDRFGRIDVLVNCAGVAPSEKIVGRDALHKLDSFSRTISINLIGTFNTMRLAADVMAKQDPGPTGERGIVINTASVAAFEGQIGQVAYAASKGGVAAMTLPAARELARHAIRVVAIAPGVFETPMMAGMSQEVQDALGASVPYPPRLGRPSEYASLVRHIVENEMLNGEVIRIDGALRMPPK
ncbi:MULTISPECIES: SDR family NAD(P)-dependent oxidoreductase [Agrobacterium]|uniref:3-hydroxy-2-methylbutyryl-CoA dehydrogenase n=1 Tax=Agrobacterium arsenijevicii TaxID=1585697 RepID=A0ABR5CZP9_9HYPH|nr:SDR family NAD(P)-dependent oxidoreductase [Agrobacterium fabrum]KJF70298.1 3-hydroxy-2-methylbutyryl-CoA dehydrogenase [Agrobacterium arsenijevicii]CUX58322.1 3-hydroxyacyl-CoA dehydrogenase (short-chain) [Agrobacterium fabrum str. J-07]